LSTISIQQCAYPGKYDELRIVDYRVANKYGTHYICKSHQKRQWIKVRDLPVSRVAGSVAIDSLNIHRLPALRHQPGR